MAIFIFELLRKKYFFNNCTVDVRNFPSYVLQTHWKVKLIQAQAHSWQYQHDIPFFRSTHLYAQQMKSLHVM